MALMPILIVLLPIPPHPINILLFLAIPILVISRFLARLEPGITHTGFIPGGLLAGPIADIIRIVLFVAAVAVDAIVSAHTHLV
jgi:hypothetical protein